MDGHDLNKLIEGVWALLQHLAMRDRIEEVVSLGEQAVRHFLEDLEHDRGIAIATLQEPEFTHKSPSLLDCIIPAHVRSKEALLFKLTLGQPDLDSIGDLAHLLDFLKFEDA